MKKQGIMSVAVVLAVLAGMAYAASPVEFLKGAWYAHVKLFPATQTIANLDTITADACGGLKRISAANAVWSSTNTPITTPETVSDNNLSGCIMDVMNVGTGNITVSTAATVFLTGGAPIVLSSSDTFRIASDGVLWRQIGDLGNN